MGVERSRWEGYGGMELGERVSGKMASVGICEENGGLLRGKTNTASGDRGVVVRGPAHWYALLEGDWDKERVNSLWPAVQRLPTVWNLLKDGQANR
jgi:hypothetical protein